MNTLFLRKISKLNLILLFIAIISPFLTSCPKNENEKEPKPLNTPLLNKERSSAAPLVQTTLPPSKKNNPEVISLKPTPATKTSKQTEEPQPLFKENFHLGLYPQQRISPSDFKIGLLQDVIHTTFDFWSARETIRLFLKSLSNKKPDFDLCSEKARKALQALLNYPISQGLIPDNFRLGAFKFEGEKDLRANLRLYKNKAVTEGEIYLTKEENKWLITDLQIGFTYLNIEYQKPTKPFLPGSFNFLLND